VDCGLLRGSAGLGTSLPSFQDLKNGTVPSPHTYVLKSIAAAKTRKHHLPFCTSTSWLAAERRGRAGVHLRFMFISATWACVTFVPVAHFNQSDAAFLAALNSRLCSGTFGRDAAAFYALRINRVTPRRAFCIAAGVFRPVGAPDAFLLFRAG